MDPLLRRALAALVLVAATIPAGASALPALPQRIEGTRSLFEAERLIYGERGAREETLGLIDRAERAFQRDRRDALTSYWLARAELLRATYLNQQGDTRAAEAAVDRGFTHIERALDDGAFSDGLRVVADLHSQMMFARGLFYMIRNGDDARDAALAARDLAPDNVKALISVAGFLLNAPAIAGGDPGEARRVLTGALALDSPNENDRYLILGWLADAAWKTGDRDAARTYLAQAARIHGETEWLESIEAGWE